MISIYAGIPCRYTTLLQALEQKYGESLTFEPGCSDVECKNASQIEAAAKAAASADTAVIAVGLSQSIEREGLDREDLKLPGFQEKLVMEVSEAAPGPVVLVIMAAGPVDVSFAKNNSKIGAILWAGSPLDVTFFMHYFQVVDLLLLGIHKNTQRKCPWMTCI